MAAFLPAAPLLRAAAQFHGSSVGRGGGHQHGAADLTEL